MKTPVVSKCRIPVAVLTRILLLLALFKLTQLAPVRMMQLCPDMVNDD